MKTVNPRRIQRLIAGRERAAEYLAERLFFEFEKQGAIATRFVENWANLSRKTISRSSRLRRCSSCGSCEVHTEASSNL